MLMPVCFPACPFLTIVTVPKIGYFGPVDNWQKTRCETKWENHVGQVISIHTVFCTTDILTWVKTPVNRKMTQEFQYAVNKGCSDTVPFSSVQPNLKVGSRILDLAGLAYIILGVRNSSLEIQAYENISHFTVIKVIPRRCFCCLRIWIWHQTTGSVQIFSSHNVVKQIQILPGEWSRFLPTCALGCHTALISQKRLKIKD